VPDAPDLASGTPPPNTSRLRARCSAESIWNPASCEIAQTVVGASAFFSVEDDGLVQEWRGRVFLNPPYSRGLITRFVDKLLLELRAGRVQQAILLVNADTDTKWFHRAAAASASICFTKRIRFWGPNGDGKSPTTGSAFFYFGPNVEQFSAAFEGFGMIR
jgi:DNA N-6-adenine-methyltransferase (Dam)